MFVRVEDWPYFKTCICQSENFVHLRWDASVDEPNSKSTICGRKRTKDVSRCRSVGCGDCIAEYQAFLTMEAGA